MRRRRKPRPHHAADPNRSDRLFRLLEALKNDKRHGISSSSLQLARAAKLVALSASIHELRLRGHLIECSRRAGVWYYRLVRA